MSSVQDLLSLAQYDRQKNMAYNPAEGFTTGFLQSQIEEIEKRKREETTKTGYSKLMQILNGSEDDYQNNYRIKPTFNAKTGEVGVGLAEKSDADRFTQAVQSGANPYMLRKDFPQFADKIDALEIAGVFGKGQQIQPAQASRIIPAEQPGVVTGSGRYEAVPNYDALGRIKGYDTKKTAEAEKQELIEKAEIKGNAKLQENKQKALGNFGRMASAIKLFADYYKGGIDEGGVGSITNKKKSEIALSLGGGLGDKFVNTGKLYGQGVEMSLASIPIMTGQNRFVESLREALKKTYPQGQEGPELAAGMLEQTLVNMYMTNKVLTRLGIDIDNPKAGDSISDEETDAILTSAGFDPSTQKWNASSIYALDEEERAELDRIKKDVLGNLRGEGNPSVLQGKTKSGLKYRVIE